MSSLPLRNRLNPFKREFYPLLLVNKQLAEEASRVLKHGAVIHLGIAFCKGESTPYTRDVFHPIVSEPLWPGDIHTTKLWRLRSWPRIEEIRNFYVEVPWFWYRNRDYLFERVHGPTCCCVLRFQGCIQIATFLNDRPRIDHPEIGVPPRKDIGLETALEPLLAVRHVSKTRCFVRCVHGESRAQDCMRCSDTTYGEGSGVSEEDLRRWESFVKSAAV